MCIHEGRTFHGPAFNGLIIRYLLDTAFPRFHLLRLIIFFLVEPNQGCFEFITFDHAAVSDLSIFVAVNISDKKHSVPIDFGCVIGVTETIFAASDRKKPAVLESDFIIFGTAYAYRAVPAGRGISDQTKFSIMLSFGMNASRGRPAASAT